MTALLELEAIEAGYGEVQVLWGISLKAKRGQMTTIVGANGAGKTTTLRALAGSIPARRGRVLFEGEDVTKLPPHAKVARGIVLVPEARQLFAAMSVEENLEMGAFSGRMAGCYSWTFCPLRTTGIPMSVARTASAPGPIMGRSGHRAGFPLKGRRVLAEVVGIRHFAWCRAGWHIVIDSGGAPSCARTCCWPP